jgi:hypothetical protein
VHLQPPCTAESRALRQGALAFHQSLLLVQGARRPASPSAVHRKPKKVRHESQSLAGNKHATFALHVPVATLLFFGRRSGDLADTRVASWVSTVLEAPEAEWHAQARDAALWGEKIAPIMDITVVDLRCALAVRPCMPPCWASPLR